LNGDNSQLTHLPSKLFVSAITSSLSRSSSVSSLEDEIPPYSMIYGFSVPQRFMYKSTFHISQ